MAGFGQDFIAYYLRIKEAELAYREVTEWEQREFRAVLGRCVRGSGSIKIQFLRKKCWTRVTRIFQKSILSGHAPVSTSRLRPKRGAFGAFMQIVRAKGA
jgi:hypothetical protein